MHTVSTEVLVMTMSCTQSNPPANVKTDIRAATYTEVLLPFAQDQDQASTAAPADDEQDVFGREEALRMDEAITDFPWFDNIPLGQHQGRAWHDVRPTPTRFKFALQRAQHAILRAIMHNNPSSLAQHGRLLCSAAGSSWCGFLSMRRQNKSNHENER